MRFTTVLSAQSWPKKATLPRTAGAAAALSDSGACTAAYLPRRRLRRLLPVHGRGDDDVEIVEAGRPPQGPLQRGDVGHQGGWVARPPRRRLRVERAAGAALDRAQ